MFSSRFSVAKLLRGIFDRPPLEAVDGTEVTFFAVPKPQVSEELLRTVRCPDLDPLFCQVIRIGIALYLTHAHVESEVEKLGEAPPKRNQGEMG